MESAIAPRGLIVDLITPLLRNGAIDHRGLKRLLDRMAAKCQAILLASPHMGEGNNLGLDLRSELFDISMGVIRAKIPILLWVTQDTEEKTREGILALKKSIERRRYTGQVFWVDTPLYYHSNRGLPAYYQDLGSMVERPFILHNDPSLINRLEKPLKRDNIRTSILKELCGLVNIAGLVFLGAFERGHNYHRACHWRTDFRIYDGDETHFLDHPSMSGVISAGANLAPDAWRKITESSLHLTGDRKKYPDYLQQVWRLGQYLLDLHNICHKRPVAIVKGVLADKGIIETPSCTSPAEDMEEAKSRIKELMLHYGNYE